MPLDWLTTVHRCQDEVEALTSNSYYSQAYRAREGDYWSLIPAWIAEDATIKRPARCLDIGCAYGTLALYCQEVTGAEIYCLDWTNKYLGQRLITHHGLHFALRNIELDPLPWALQFGAIVLTEVLEHFNFHPVPTLRKLADHLDEGGRLYLSTPDASEWGRTGRYRHVDDMPQPDPALPLVDDHVHVFDEAEMLAAVGAAGLQVVRFGYSPGYRHRHFNLTLARKE